jgi:hypothetical protein
VRPFAADVSKTSFRHHSSISTCRSAPGADIRHRGSTRPDDARLARACCRRHRRAGRVFGCRYYRPIAR